MLTEQIHGSEATAPVYVWQYPLRLIHWGIVISIGVLSVTGYYIHDPFIYGLSNRPFLMGEFRFVHECFGMLFLSLALLRIYLFFRGNQWENWRQYIPLHKDAFREMGDMAKFYLFIRPRPVSKIGHNRLAALSYLGLYFLILVEAATGLVMYQRLLHNAFLLALVGWIPRFVDIQTLRQIHFFLMYVFIAFGIFHVHLAMLVSRFEKHGLMDSIFIGYKVIPMEEIEAGAREDRAVAHK